jgi:hypothetical protein
MVEPRSSVAGAALAKRLRELRVSGFPGKKVTQAHLAQALSQDESVADSTLSSWENSRSPTIPPHSRLSAYARFFATERSLEGQPHLVPLSDLSAGEQQVREELELELFQLRDSDVAGPLPARRFWRFDDAPVTLICSDLRRSDQKDDLLGPLSNEENPNYAKLYSYGDLDALFDLHGHLCSSNPGKTVEIGRVPPDDLHQHLVVLGGIAWNPVMRRLNDALSLPIEQVEDAEKSPTGEIFATVTESASSERFLPRWKDDNPGTLEEPGVLIEDVGMLARLPSPYDDSVTLTYCNGIHSRGVLGAVRCLTDPAVSEKNESYLDETFRGSDRFVILMKVKVFGGVTVSPSLRDAGIVLYKWSGNTTGNR